MEAIAVLADTVCSGTIYLVNDFIAMVISMIEGGETLAMP